MKIAFYKGKGMWADSLIRWWTKGPYSHCELVFTDGVWGTAFYQGGLLLRPRTVADTDWDYVDLPASLEADARKWFEQHKGKAYDYLGLARFVFGFLHPSRDKWFCSRACADALGMTDGWREDPNGLHAEIISMAKSRG